MNSFQYVTATTPAEAAAQIGKNGRYLAGGIDLLGELKEYIVSPDVLVALKMTGTEEKIRPHVAPKGDDKSPDSLWINFDVTMAELAVHPDIVAKFPALAQAAGEVGSPQIRNVATLGGNLLQHSRCWYYRQPDIACLKRGGTTCYAIEGENRYLSLYGHGSCVSPVVSNMATALSALDARIHLLHQRKEGPLTLEHLYSAAWSNPAVHNSLQPGEFLTGVTIPLKRTRSAYRQVSEKREFDWALVSCAAAGNVANGKITDPLVALGAIAPGPHMNIPAQAFLEGKELTEENVSKAADMILEHAKPLSQNGYKVPMAHALIRRTLLALNT